MIGLAAKVAIRTATIGVVDGSHIAELKDMGESVASGASEIGAEIIEKKIEGYAVEKDSLKSFKQSLEKLAKLVRDQQGFPLTIVVDELDRCRPDFALNLLERMKHLFDVKGVAFVLLVNRRQIESYIRAVYGQEVDASAYLLKFANLFVDLPIQDDPHRDDSGRNAFSRSLFNHYGFSRLVDDGNRLARSVESLVKHFNLTLRETEKIFLLFSLYYGSKPPGQITDEFLVAMLAVYKVKKPDFYRQLSDGRLSALEFFDEAGLDRMDEKFGLRGNVKKTLDWLRYLVMTDGELSSAKMTSGWVGFDHYDGLLERYDFKRRELIPFLCGRLDMFSLAPT